jgi:IS605 OrfB family transposase
MKSFTPAVPFWNSKSESLSKQIWNPEEYKDGLIENKSLYMNQKIHPSYLTNKIKAENIESSGEKITLSRKIRFYPNKEQKSYFNKFFSAHRYFFNKTIEDINNQYSKRKELFGSKPTCIFCSNPKEESSFTCESHKNKSIPWEINSSFFTLRTKLVKAKKNLGLDELWQDEIPCHTKQLAVKDGVAAYNSAVSNKRRGNIKSFQLKYMSKKKPSHIFWITPNSVNVKNKQVSVFKTFLKENSILNVNIKQRQRIPEENNSAAKILYDRGAWYIVFTIEEQVETKCDNLHSISLDPGVRTFQTGYSPNGSFYKFGEKQNLDMRKIYDKIDKLKSVLDSKNPSPSYKTKYNIKNRLVKLELKLRGIIHNLHNQVGSYLSKNYKYILLPEFETSGIQQSDNLHSTTKRRMNGLAHYKFKIKMEHFCKKYGSQLNIVDESYTSKTCGSCGNVKEDLGSDCHYNCSKCGYNLDRDIHGARNIWIKTYS